MDKEMIIAALYAAGNVYCDPAHPLRGGAGFYQPIYLDHRNVLSFPQEREVAITALDSLLPKRDAFEVIAGNETAGIAFAGMLAERRRVPMVYVRKTPKAGGAGKQIEGILTAGQCVVIVDDMMVTGGNIARAADAIARAGGKVIAAIVISVVRPEIGGELSARGITTQWLVTFRDIVDWGIRERRFSRAQVQAIEDYLADPTGWGVEHGLAPALR